MTKLRGLRGLDLLAAASKTDADGNSLIPTEHPPGRRRMLFGTLEELREIGRRTAGASPHPSADPSGTTGTTSAAKSGDDMYRVLDFGTQPAGEQVRCFARLYRAGETVRVHWTTTSPPARLRASRSLVAIRGPIDRNPDDKDGVAIRYLALLDRPVAGVNLFDFVPEDWVRNREIIDDARLLTSALSVNERWLYNAIFWDADRFWRYCTGPSSMQGHHAERCGNLRHSVEVARHMQREFAGRGADPAAIGRAILLGLLHDAGKADEYRQVAMGRQVMSDRGRLVGHRQTISQWVAVAIAQWRIPIPERQVLAILNGLVAVPGAPDWIGLPRPATLEARLLSVADRWSGQSDLIERQAAEAGWGAPHPHLDGSPFSP
jgi:3'-5' exoribonuclease